MKKASKRLTDGHCKEVLLKAAEHLVRDKGAQALILGCTELPLILEETDNIKLGDGHAAIVDPPLRSLAVLLKLPEKSQKSGVFANVFSS